MKKLFLFLAATLIAAAFMLSTSCNNANAPTTPAGIEKAMYEELLKGNYEQAMTVYFNNVENMVFEPLDSNITLEDSRKEYITEFAKKTKESYDAKGGLKSYEIVKEEIFEDGNTAIVETKLVYGNGTEETDTTKYVKKDDGTWNISGDLK
ncbi:MAG: DUF4878 domain-containing protein [Bacteroidales bacterium]|jgi:hypothetical protein|nr:DUF4878 domain-containing protein [Bacteroidales bacterium]